MGDFSRVYKTDITDRQMMAFWSQVQAAGRDRAVSYCLPPKDGLAFCHWMRQPDIHPWAVLYKGEPVGMYFLSDRQGKSAQVHFCVLPTGTRRVAPKLSLSRAAGLYALGASLWESNVSGGSIIDTLIGVTPACNRAALKYASSLGGQQCGVVPGYCYYHDTGENVTGVFTVFTRETVPAWTATL